MKDFIRIQDPAKCCGCGACVNVCPKNAVTMLESKIGFIYPHVDEELCVGCGKCAEVCVFAEKLKGANGEPLVYAAASTDKAVLMESSSGGIFTELANAVLDKGGAVFGAAWTEELTVSHICVEDKADLKRLRGSKYVQSSTGDTFRQAKQLLKDGRYVCYSGTPCQIAGLKAFLGEDFERLLTVDVICHGVPSSRMLHDDLNYVSDGKLSQISDIKFRDKSYGWGTKGSFLTDGSKVKYNAGTSPYYFYFLKGEVYRDSCYNCRFPSEGRQGDVTLGDYWGLRQELISKMNGVDPDMGVSCVLVNSEKGKMWLEAIESGILLAESDRKSAEKRNGQLTNPSVPLPEHDELLNGYVEKGYQSLRDGYKKHLKDHIVRTVKNMIPSKLKRSLNELLSKIRG